MSSASMVLNSFRVTNFRSVKDSGWVDADNATALIGTNESGKTNLLVPLWKLNPAKEGEIKLLTDAPRKEFNNYRNMAKKPTFISARFTLSESLASQIAKMTNVFPDKVKRVEVSRDFDGKQYVSFIDATPRKHITKSEMEKALAPALSDITNLTPIDEKDGSLKISVLAALQSVNDVLKSQPADIGTNEISALQAELTKSSIAEAAVESTVAARFKQFTKVLETTKSQLGQPGPNDSQDARNLVAKSL